jgi:hypothetical protein
VGARAELLSARFEIGEKVVACERLCAPGVLPLRKRRQLRERYQSLDPFARKDASEKKLKLILHPKTK